MRPSLAAPHAKKFRLGGTLSTQPRRPLMHVNGRGRWPFAPGTGGFVASGSPPAMQARTIRRSNTPPLADDRETLTTEVSS